MELFATVAYASVDSFIANANRLIVNPLIYLLFALAVVYFTYGLVKFLVNQNNDEKKTEGKSHMIYGVIGITVMMGVWGILNMVLGTINIPKSDIDPEQGTVNLKPYTPVYPPNPVP